MQSPDKADCLPPGQKRRYIGLTMYHPLHLGARERNRTAASRREQKGRRIVSEGTFASLNRLGWVRSRLRGIYGRSGPERAQGRATVAPRHRTPAPLKLRAAADGVQATQNACGEPTNPDGPPRSRSTGFLIMNVVAQEEPGSLGNPLQVLQAAAVGSAAHGQGAPV